MAISEKPIIFNQEMVKAILEGRKTQTRRIIKPQPKYIQKLNDDRYETSIDGGFDNDVNYIKSPYQIGQKLWVRETFFVENTCCYYKANWDFDKSTGKEKWKPSIFMPKKYARIWLEVADVRVNRIQNISESDSIKEGIPLVHNSYGLDRYGIWINKKYISNESAATIFMCLWDSINEKRGYSWKSNPWVWVIEFKREK